MRITADYHTHTVFSHGKGTIEENVLAAIQKGLKAIAITDHSPGHMLYGIRKVTPMLEEIQRVRKAYAGRIEVLVGLEGDLCSLDGTTDLPLEKGRYDLFILGYHRAARMAWRDSIWFSVRNGFLATSGSREYRAQYNALAYARAMERYPVDIIAHPGLYIPLDIGILAKAATEHGVALEINGTRPTMSVEQIHQAKRLGARFIINSDAHRVDRVGCFERALAVADAAGLSAADLLNAEP